MLSVDMDLSLLKIEGGGRMLIICPSGKHDVGEGN